MSPRVFVSVSATTQNDKTLSNLHEEVPKSIRSLESMVSQWQLKLNTAAEELKAQVDLARASGPSTSSEAMALEMQSALNKLKAIQIVLTGSQQDWRDYVASLQKDSSETASVNTHGSANLLALIGSGPCHNFENIAVVATVAAKKNDMVTASAATELEKTHKEAGEAISLWGELAQNCKRASCPIERHEREAYCWVKQGQRQAEGQGQREGERASWQAWQDV